MSRKKWKQQIKPLCWRLQKLQQLHARLLFVGQDLLALVDGLRVSHLPGMLLLLLLLLVASLATCGLAFTTPQLRVVSLLLPLCLLLLYLKPVTPQGEATLVIGSM